MHRSVATIQNPEFINLTPLDINPLMSSCEIKVFYLGENRNRSYISKEVAKDMAKTLRGAPIVGYFSEADGDFKDHGERMIIDGDGIKFDCLTKPYGFVAPDAKVWFQTFEDTDDFGNVVEREYLMTTGYLWTEQFPECKCAVEGDGRPHSMELDENTLDGNWSKNQKTGIDFFIINDAIISKLCVLGEAVEPCFEGSSVKSPEVSASFTMVDDTFKNTLFSMMQDLKFALEGGKESMPENENITTIEEAPIGTEPIVEEPVADTAAEGNVDEVTSTENQNLTEDSSSENKPADEFAKEKEKEDKAEEKEDKAEEKEDKADEDKKKKDNSDSDYACKDDEDEEKKKNFTALEQELAELKTQFSAMETEYKELLAFKANIENEKKDALIQSFYMLSEEDKKDVIENKAKYSLDEIESKLSVICVRKKVNFDLEDTSKNDSIVEETPVTTFNLNEAESAVPAWIKALRATRDNG